MFSFKKKTMYFLAGLFALAEVFSLSAISLSVLAADSPDEIQDTYEIDGITYFHVNNNQFSTYPEQYLKAMLEEQSTYLAGNSGAATQSIADLWLRTALGIDYKSRWKSLEDDDYLPANTHRLMENVILNHSGSAQSEIEYQGDAVNKFRSKQHNLTYFPSLKQAENWVINNSALDWGSTIHSGQVRDGLEDIAVFTNEDDDKTQHVLATMIDLWSPLNTIIGFSYKPLIYDMTAAVYFTDFEIVTLLPEDSGKNYVSEITKETSSNEGAVASNVKNLTATTISTSQSVNKSHSASLSSSISGSQNYSFSESLKVSAKNKFSFFGIGGTEVTAEFGFSASQSISKGWSEGESESDSKSTTQSVSVTLPPYTNVMLTQKNTSTEQVTSYNCPVGLKYKATVVLYWKKSVSSEFSKSSLKSASYSFGMDSRKELNKWAVDLPSVVNPYELNWSQIRASVHGVTDAVTTLGSHVPMSSTGATFTTTLNTMENEVSGIMPIYALSSVKLSAPDISFIDSGLSYDGYNYLTARMNVGDHSYTNYLTLKGYNNKGGEYYGFRKNSGTWIVLDEDGNTLVDKNGQVHGDPPVIVKRDAISGNTRYTAVKPGRCYLKFLINEDIYSTASEPDRFTTNEDLNGKTAVLEIIVTSGCKDNEHRWDDGVTTTPATCEKTGVRTYTCEACGKTRTEKIAALGHDWSEWEVSRAATEKEEGEETRFCLNDNTHTQTRSIPKTSHKHTMVRTKKKAASCTKDGSAAYYTCSSCGRLFSDEKGEKEIDEDDLILSKTGHRWDEGIVTKEASCTASGVRTYTCLNCDETKTEKIPALSHKWSDWETAEEASETKAGKESRYCLNDPSHTQTRKIPKLTHKHKLVRRKKKAATCTKDGTRAYYICKTCGKLYLDAKGKREIDKEDIIILKRDHKWNSGEVTREPTCKKTGKEVFTCLRCGKKKTKKLQALGHSWSSWQVDKSPTTEETGLKIRFCLNNPSHVQKMVVAKLTKESQTDWSSPSGNTDSRDNSGSSSSTSRSNRFFFAHPSQISANAVTLKWTRVENAQQYVIYGAKCGENMEKIAVVDSSAQTRKISNISGNELKKNVYYKFYVAAYGSNSSGQSEWLGNTPVLHLVLNGSSELGNFDHITLSTEQTVTLSKGGTAVVKAVQMKAANETRKVPKHRKVYYLSTDSAIAKVNRTSGKVTGVSKGTCEIYCISQNGLYATVKVHVK